MRALAAQANATVTLVGHEALAPRFGVPFLGFCLLAALLVSWWPLQLSIATVFLFAGPHNWMEFRYFLSRMPARWGRSRSFFAVGLGGTLLLTAAYTVLFWLGQTWYLSEAAWTAGVSLWGTALLVWACALVWLRGRRRAARGDYLPVYAAGSALAALAWVAPQWFFLALVYAHPLVALWFLDRQLKRTRPHWRKTYHLCLAALPLLLLLMWSRLAGAPDLAETDALSWRITRHAGASILPGVSTHLLVATHVFLETIHYGAWLVLIPLAGLQRAGLFETRRIPLAVHRRGGWPRAVKASLLFGAFVVVALWAFFWADYTTTRDLYFTLAMGHVLAEVPFLLRLL
ncbi:MAG TPA: hypothetical protein VF240_09660 [Pyrinomonadaceae bacterium]